MDKTLSLEFEKFVNQSLNEMLLDIYQKPNANRYLASFTYFIKTHQHHPQIQALLNEAFQLFLKIHFEPFRNKFSPNIAFTGSVASIFREELTHACHSYNLNVIAIESSPMKKLIHYHLRQQKLI